MTANTGDTVRITEGARKYLDSRPDIDLNVGDEVTVVGTLDDPGYGMTRLLGAPDGAIWVEASNPRTNDGGLGLAPGEYELVAA